MVGAAIPAVLGWADPTAAPPGGNAPPPLTTSSTIQTKIGGLNIATTSGNVGIGTTSPGRKLTVSGDVLFSGDTLLQPNIAGVALTVSQQGTGPITEFATVAGTAFRIENSRNAWFRGGDVMVGSVSRTTPGAEFEIISALQNSLRLTKSDSVAGSVELFVAVGDATSRTGSALCDTIVGSSICLGHWSGGGAESTCATSLTTSRALCADWGS